MRKATKIIPMNAGQHAIVDARDYEMLSRHKWYYRKGRAVCDCKGLKMHHMIVQPLPGFVVHHVNHRTNDNSRANLLVVPRGQHCRYHRQTNKTGFKGISFHHRSGNFEARLCIGGRVVSVGSSKSKYELAARYDAAATSRFGPHIYINFPRVIRRAYLRRFVNRTRGRIFFVHFHKRHSSEFRDMVCRTMKPPQPGNFPYDARHHRVIVVYDMQRRGYRIIPIEGVICLKFKNTYYRVA